MGALRIAMAQINPTVGDLRGNAEKISGFLDRAIGLDIDLIVFPELAITGYPPEDLLLKPQFVKGNITFIKKIARKTKGITAIVGFVDSMGDIYNAAAVIHNGEIAGVYHKMFLPNYGVFDEERYFHAGKTPLNIVLNGITIGIGICEDIWHPEGPARVQSLAGAEVIVNINASPYHMGKARFREEMIAARAADNGVIVVYNNMVGGQDELVFDGQGMIADEKGNIIARGKAFEEDFITAELDVEGIFNASLHDPRKRKEKIVLEVEIKKVKEIVLHTKPGKRKKLKRLAQVPINPPEQIEEVYKALTLGTKDYVRKNGFSHTVVGLSGGIDSSLVAAIAVDALGKSNVTGVFMPSMYSSGASSEDAENLAKNMEIEFLTIPIQETFEKYLTTLSKTFKKIKPDVTEENIQARIRGNILMALSNKFGWLVLTTGNKSEMSVGYATLYGDMAGGFAVIKDVPKTLVYKLAEYRNKLKTQNLALAGFKQGSKLKINVLIPERVLRKAPTAELRPNQTDQDTLPPYEILDSILRTYVEEDKSFEDIAAMGFNKGIVKKVIRMVDASEYKRRQSPPGIKITPRALGKDRRMPITNRYRSY
ncbi:MAG: NAD+ synthase [Deltaproteobacteria bacterium GWC2_42_11]|nr:MAG: NAD+ synthase [Deltaproteobacteria bacterium GWC2_42_11]HBO84597.1 NAD+ synthase [Deltaproteobacteria bacterium]